MDSSTKYYTVYTFIKEKLKLSFNKRKYPLLKNILSTSEVESIKNDTLSLLGDVIHFFPKSFVVVVLAQSNTKNNFLKDIFVDIINSFSEKCEISSILTFCENYEVKIKNVNLESEKEIDFSPTIQYIFEKFKDLVYFNFDFQDWDHFLKKYIRDRNFYYIFVKNIRHLPINRVQLTAFYTNLHTNEFLCSFSNEEWLTYDTLAEFLYGDKCIIPNQKTVCHFLLKTIETNGGLSFVSIESEKFFLGWLKSGLNLEELLMEAPKQDFKNRCKFIFLLKYAEKHCNFQIPSLLFPEPFYNVATSALAKFNKNKFEEISPYILFVWDICTYEKKNERFLKIVQKTLSRAINHERECVDFAYSLLTQSYRKAYPTKEGKKKNPPLSSSPPLSVLMLREVIYLQCKIEYTKFGYWQMIQ